MSFNKLKKSIFSSNAPSGVISIQGYFLSPYTYLIGAIIIRINTSTSDFQFFSFVLRLLLFLNLITQANI